MGSVFGNSNWLLVFVLQNLGSILFSDTGRNRSTWSTAQKNKPKNWTVRISDWLALLKLKTGTDWIPTPKLWWERRENNRKIVIGRSGGHTVKGKALSFRSKLLHEPHSSAKSGHIQWMTSFQPTYYQQVCKSLNSYSHCLKSQRKRLKCSGKDLIQH